MKKKTIRAVVLVLATLLLFTSCNMVWDAIYGGSIPDVHNRYVTEAFLHLYDKAWNSGSYMRFPCKSPDYPDSELVSGDRSWNSEYKYYYGNSVLMHEGRTYNIEFWDYRDPVHSFITINGAKFHLHGEWYEHQRNY